MVGADSKAVFDEAAMILKLMGKNIVHCGAIGNGQVAKLCNNMMLGISMIGVSEAMSLGVKCAFIHFAKLSLKFASTGWVLTPRR